MSEVADQLAPERVTEVAEIGLEQIVEMLDKLEADVTQALSLHAPTVAQAFVQQFSEIRRGLVGMDLQAARAALNGGSTSFDGLADAVLARLATFLAELHATASMTNLSGIAFDAPRFSSGLIKYLRLVPVDKVGGEDARRVPKD